MLHYFLCKAKQRWHLTPRAVELPPETWWDVSGDGEGVAGSEKQNASGLREELALEKWEDCFISLPVLPFLQDLLP